MNCWAGILSSSSSTSSHADSMEFSDCLSPFVPIIHRYWQFLQITPLQIWYICWLANTGVPLCRITFKNVTYEFVIASPACLIWMVHEMGNKWPYSCCFFLGGGVSPWIRSKHHKILLCISHLAFLPMRFGNVHVVHPYSSTDAATALKNVVLYYRIDQVSIWSITNQ